MQEEGEKEEVVVVDSLAGGCFGGRYADTD